jgi:hypothetical protein
MLDPFFLLVEQEFIEDIIEQSLQIIEVLLVIKGVDE